MGRRRERGGSPWAAWGGPWGGLPFGPPRGRGRRAQRGDIRTAVLAVLDEEPRHGYEVITELETRSGGRWRPSPGSIYPTLQMFEDKGLVTGEDRDGKRVFSLTDEGRKVLHERRDRGDWTPPWEHHDDPSPLRDAAFSLMAAAMQAGGSGNERQQQVALESLTEARRKIYAALAED